MLSQLVLGETRGHYPPPPHGLMENLRRGYGFTNEAKQYARDRGNKHCEFGDGTCPNPNTGRVNHITGAFEGFLDHRNPKDISDPRQNATMECRLHEAVHDAQERFQVQCLKGETVFKRSKYFRMERRRNERTKTRNRRYSSR